MDADEIIAPDQEIDFCTLSMFIIDEIHYVPPKPPLFNIIGGGGTYSALGARLFSPPPQSRTISWIVDIGSDFPPEITKAISAWQTSSLLRRDPTRLTTRGWNSFNTLEERSYKYLTPRLRLNASDLTPTLLFSKSFHLLCSPSRCISLVRSILAARKTLNPLASKPLFIWEPVPDCATSDELLNLTNALPYIDICSPNHTELAGFMSDPDSGLDAKTGEISTEAVERACEQLLGSMALQSYALVIRCGVKGCYIAKNGGRSRRPSVVKRKRPRNHARGGLTMDTDMEALFAGLLDGEGSFEREVVPVDPGIERWLPAFFDKPSAVERVVDPTGGGNGFLGGLAVGLARGKGLLEAAAWGSIAASFCIEQVGGPTLSIDSLGRETWNGDTVERRMNEYLSKVGRPPLLEISESFDKMDLA